MSQDADNSIRRTPRPKRHLAMRMLVAKLAWLEGVPVWAGERIAWQESGSSDAIAPSPSDLARAQRCLHKIRRYPLAAPQVLGDSAAWLNERQGRLETIKQLASLRASAIPALVGKAEASVPDALVRLLELLAAEAICVNSLPASPVRALVGLGLRAAGGLAARAMEPSALPEARALAALALGAVHHRNEHGGHAAPPSFSPAGPAERAYFWGRRRGLPSEPALVCALLSDENGTALASRCLAAVATGLPLALKPEVLRRLLAQRLPPAHVTVLAEAVAAARPLAERIARYREELPDRRAPERQEAARALNEQRRQAVNTLCEVYEEYALATKDPQTVSLLTPFVFSMLDLAPPTEAWTKAVLDMLRGGLSVPEPAAYLTLLTESHSRQQDRPPLPTLPKDPAKRLLWRIETQRKWLVERRRTALSLAALLRQTGDAAIAGESLALGLHRPLEDFAWTDRDRYRWLLALAASLPPAESSWQSYRFCELVDGLGTVEMVRAALHPILTALGPETPDVRAQVWDALLDEIGWERAARRRVMPRMGRHAASLARFARQTRHPDHLAACVAGLLRLDQTQPEQAQQGTDWLLAELLAREARGEEITEQSIRSASLLAAALGDREPERFQAIFQASLGHAVRVEEHRLEQGLALLGRFPALRSPLAEIFPRQPKRCVELLVRLGLTTRLGTEALAPLNRLYPQREQAEETKSAAHFPLVLCPDAGWWRLHKLCPEMDAVAASYQHACWILNQSPALPPGVRQAMSQPERLARELAHLERLAGAAPLRPDLGKRRDRLRVLLADREQLTAEARAALGERLPRFAAEAQIAALERQIQECYQARLEALAGPLPQTLRLTEDWINAILLAADISQNRRLLLRLLRAHLAGETRWREEHPDNLRFLDSLAARNVDTAAWLAARPRRYPCAGAAGGQVHLWLERDPLHVLQMGNYFDTCLSFDDFNAFSTVANACELNKRVVYARDGAGHIVGRKLIGIAETGDLVGFRTYSSLTGAEANDSLRAVFRHYLAAFASDCGLALADQGKVPTLFAEAWYDDGTAAWNSAETVAAVATKKWAGDAPLANNRHQTIR